MVRKRELTIGIAIFLIATSAYLLGWTNLFSVRALQINGAPNEQIVKTVNKYSQVTVGEKMARVEPRSIESRLTSAGIDWLESVDISRSWVSGRVIITLKAREAIATVGEQFVDASGVLFKSPVTISTKMPELQGLTRKIRASAINLYQSLPADFKVRVLKITARSEDQFQLQVLLENQLKDQLKDQQLKPEKIVRINWGSARDTEVKLKIYEALVALPENKDLKSMDLSDPTKPSVK